MNIGIVLGISEYDTQAPLPPCVDDANRLYQLLELTGKYDHKLRITGRSATSDAKNRIREFLDPLRGQAVDELLFYFSGHGTCPDSLYFCCSDFDPKRPNSTGLENEELDDLFRGMSPAQMVKVIDACNSGIQYVKGDASPIEKALRKTGFKSFVCMASCDTNQFSYADTNGSHFTREFLAAIKCAKEGQRILYRDIKASISDSFQGSPAQTPIFIFQGNGQEFFSIASPALLAGLSTIIPTPKPAPAPVAQSEVESAIAKRLSELAADYVSEPELNTSLSQAKAFAEGFKISDALVAKFYKPEINSSTSLDSLPKSLSIAEFASRSKWPAIYYVDLIHEDYTEKVLKNFYLRLPNEPGDEDYIRRTRSRPARIKSRHQLPWEVLVLDLLPIQAGLSKLGLIVGVVHSKNQALVLSTLCRYRESQWDRWQIDESSIEWKQDIIRLKEIVREPKRLLVTHFDRLVAEARKHLVEIADLPDPNFKPEAAKQ